MSVVIFVKYIRPFFEFVLGVVIEGNSMSDVQAIFFVVGLVKDDFFYPSITCPVFWYISR